MQTINDPEIDNVGAGKSLSTRVLAEMVKNVVSCERDIIQDLTQPNGTVRIFHDVIKPNGLEWKQ